MRCLHIGSIRPLLGKQNGVLTVDAQLHDGALIFAAIVGRHASVQAGMETSDTLQHQRPCRYDDTAGHVLDDGSTLAT